jgi:hypothetical protein
VGPVFVFQLEQAVLLEPFRVLDSFKQRDHLEVIDEEKVLATVANAKTEAGVTLDLKDDKVVSHFALAGDDLFNHALTVFDQEVVYGPFDVHYDLYRRNLALGVVLIFFWQKLLIENVVTVIKIKLV